MIWSLMNFSPAAGLQAISSQVVHDGRRSLVPRILDHGDAQPVPHCLQRDGLQLEAILVTRDQATTPEPAAATRANRRADLRGWPAARGRRHIDTLEKPQMPGLLEPPQLELINYIQHCEELRAPASRYAIATLARASQSTVSCAHACRAWPRRRAKLTAPPPEDHVAFCSHPAMEERT
jgi:hypothetical protein